MLPSKTRLQHETSLGAIQVTALDQLPLAVVLFSQLGEILFVNQQCHSLFGHDVVRPDSPLSTLPIAWTSGPQNAIKRLTDPGFDQPTVLFEQAVKIFGPTKQPVVVDVYLTNLQGVDRQTRMLTLEHAKSQTPSISTSETSNSIESHDVEDKISNGASRTDTGSRRSSSQSSLHEKLTHLREAIYFNHDAAGFLMDADETFCFPNIFGAVHVQPVRLKNGRQDFVDWYTVFDTDFRNEVPFEQWPLPRLCVQREKFDWYRIGLRTEGKEVICEVSGNPLWDKDTGEYIGCVVWVRTLGTREEVRLANMKAELSDYQMICEKLPHILWTMTPDGDCDYFTSNWYKFTGLSKEQSLGKGFMQAVHPDDLPTLELDRAATLSEYISEPDIDHSSEARYRKYDGTWHWFTVAARPLLDIDGKVLKWYGTLTEVQALVTERQEADRKKTQMQDMLALADVSLFNLDSRMQLSVFQGKPFWTSQARTFLCTSLYETQPGGIPVLELHARAVMDGSLERADFEFDLRDRWYKCRLVGDIDGEHDSMSLLGCTVDITDQRQKAQLLLENTRLVTERSMALEKNRLKDEFLAHMSHEIRTPIAGVIGMAELLHESGLTAKQTETLNDISDSAKNLLDIVNDILDLSKIDSGKTVLEHVEVNVSELVDTIGRVFQHSVRNKPVRLIYGESLPPRIMMMGDPTKIRQIISNLLSNAIKFTLRGSVTLAIASTPNEIIVSVEDTGVGISRTTLTKLFTPFVQGDSSTARKFGGTGLGLAICRGLAEMMDGTLEIQSELGKGTTARLLLPRKMTAESAGRSTVADNRKEPIISTTLLTGRQTQRREGRTTILIAEDNLVNQKFALHLVKKHGYYGIAVANGQEALDHLLNEPTNIALVLMDCQMPMMDGYEASRRIRNDEMFAYWKEIPIVALTASAIVGDRQKCEAAGMYEYLTKPVSYERFAEVVGKWLPARTKEQMEADPVFALLNLMRGTPLSRKADAGTIEDCKENGENNETMIDHQVYTPLFIRDQLQPSVLTEA